MFRTSAPAAFFHHCTYSMRSSHEVAATAAWVLVPRGSRSKSEQRSTTKLVREIAGLNPGSLGDAARYGELAFAFDHAFDHIQTWEEWIVAVCTKHRAAYHEKLDQLESS